MYCDGDRYWLWVIQKIHRHVQRQRSISVYDFSSRHNSYHIREQMRENPQVPWWKMRNNASNLAIRCWVDSIISKVNACSLLCPPMCKHEAKMYWIRRILNVLQSKPKSNTLLNLAWGRTPSLPVHLWQNCTLGKSGSWRLTKTSLKSLPNSMSEA